MGYGERAAKCGIRISLGRHTTADDVDWAALVLKQVVDRSLATLLAQV
jgi:cysteine desulfurase